MSILGEDFFWKKWHTLLRSPLPKIGEGGVDDAKEIFCEYAVQGNIGNEVW